jgi:hopanoid biosynthesis associated RND transporter like protein HpnN
MKQPAASFRYRLFSALARLDERRPWYVLAAAIALAAVCVWYTRARLEFRTGQDDLISADSRDSRNYLRYTREFPDLDGVIVVIPTDPSETQAEQFADSLAKRLNADKVNVKSVFYRIDPGLMGDRALLYLDTSELKSLATRMATSLPILRAYATDPHLVNLFGGANQMLEAAASSRMQGSPPLDFSLLDPVLTGMLAGPSAAPSSPWSALIPDEDQSRSIRDTYLSSSNGKYLLMHVAPAAGADNGPDPVEAIEAHLAAVHAFLPQVAAGITGGPALAYAEESTTRHDMMLGSIIAVIGLTLLLVIPFRGIVEPFFSIVALLVGVAWSFGFTTLVVGHLNLLSAVFTSVLAGIGINFPIHLMARYDEARRRGLPMPEALELAVVNTGTGVFASACIMALAFLMPMFTDFRGIAELGEISAAGLFLCLISAMLVFPALIALRDRRAGKRPPIRISLAPGRSTLERLFARPGWITGLTVAATLAASVLIRGVTFEQDVLRLQASDAEAVRFENILLRDSGRSSWFAVALAGSQKIADRKAAAFRKLAEVSDVETIATYLPDDQDAKRALLGQMRGELAGLAIRPLAHPGAPDALLRELEQLDARLTAFAPIDSSGGASKTRDLVASAITRLKVNPAAFAGYERRLASDLDTRLTQLKGLLAPAPVTEQNLPQVMRDRFIGASGMYLVQIYPKGDVWADAALERFVKALRTVDRDVTGPPVQTYTLATVMRLGYERAAILALIAVFIFVFADFRNLRDALLATVPLVFGGAWLLEAMAVLGWDFNLANLFAVPIIIGMGVDNGVNMIYRWREEQDKSSLILTKAVGKSVTICSLTTIAAFAALIPANHRGISSLGWVLTLGVSFILLATLIVLPALFELLGSRIEHAREVAKPPTGALAQPASSAPPPAIKVSSTIRA